MGGFCRSKKIRALGTCPACATHSQWPEQATVRQQSSPSGPRQRPALCPNLPVGIWAGCMPRPRPAALSMASLTVQRRRLSRPRYCWCRVSSAEYSRCEKALASGGAEVSASASSHRVAEAAASAGVSAQKAACPLWLKAACQPESRGRPRVSMPICGRGPPLWGSAVAVTSRARARRRERAASIIFCPHGVGPQFSASAMLASCCQAARPKRFTCFHCRASSHGSSAVSKAERHATSSAFEPCGSGVYNTVSGCCMCFLFLGAGYKMYKPAVLQKTAGLSSLI